MNEATIAVTPEPAEAPGSLAEFWQAYSQSRGALIGLALIVLLLFLAIFADVISPHPPNEQYRDFTLAPPVWHDGGSSAFLLGTDPVGRDILSRLIHGTRLSLLIGTISVTISLCLGVVLGLVAGFFRGLTETVIMRLEKTAIVRVIHEEPKFAEVFISHLLARNIRVEEDLVDAVQDRVGARGVSRFVSRAIRHELEREELSELLAELEEVLGPPDAQLIAEAAAAFDQVERANKSRSRKRSA